METDPTPQEATAALAATQRLNAARLQRPPQYWTMLGLFLAVYALLPYTRDWPAWLQYLAPVGAIGVIVAFAARKQPTAVRKIRLSGSMVLALIGFAAAAGLLAGLSGALYTEHGWGWIPAATAIAMFVLVFFGGRALDRFWAKRASRGGR